MIKTIRRRNEEKKKKRIWKEKKYRIYGENNRKPN